MEKGWIAVVLITTLTNIVAKEITLCDCSTAATIGMLDLRTTPNCHTGTKLQEKEAVNFTIFTTIKPQVQFKGYLCSSWTKRVTTDVYFFGGHDTVTTTIPRDTYASDCWRIHKTLDCYGNGMISNGEKWKFEANPKGKAKWMTQQQDDIINCYIEEIKLTQQCEDCPITSSAGNLGNDSQAAVAIHNHVTVVWDNTLVQHKRKCEVVKLNAGQGYQFKSTLNGTIRIQDSKNQIEYFAVKPNIKPCNQHNLWQLNLSNEIFIQITPITNYQFAKETDTQELRKSEILTNL